MVMVLFLRTVTFKKKFKNAKMKEKPGKLLTAFNFVMHCVIYNFTISYFTVSLRMCL